MQYINHQTLAVYSGDRAHWRDIPVTSERPGPDYVPVLEDISERPYKAHVGWEHQPPPSQPDPFAASIAALTPETDANTVFEWMAVLGAENVAVASARGDINMNLLSLGNLWQSAPAMASAGLDTAFNKLWSAASEIPDGYQQIVEDWRDEYTLRSLA